MEQDTLDDSALDCRIENVKPPWPCHAAAEGTAKWGKWRDSDVSLA